MYTSKKLQNNLVTFDIKMFIREVRRETMCTRANKSNRKAMKMNWSNPKANPALKTKTGNK